MKKRMTQNAKGFSLVELLLALTIFAVGVLAVATMQLNAIRGNTNAAMLSQASTLAEDRMEELMTMDYTSLDAEAGTATDGIYTITTSITPDTSGAFSFRTISVSVTWMGRDVTLESIRGE